MERPKSLPLVDEAVRRVPSRLVGTAGLAGLEQFVPRGGASSARRSGPFAVLLAFKRGVPDHVPLIGGAGVGVGATEASADHPSEVRLAALELSREHPGCGVHGHVFGLASTER